MRRDGQDSKGRGVLKKSNPSGIFRGNQRFSLEKAGLHKPGLPSISAIHDAIMEALLPLLPSTQLFSADRINHPNELKCFSAGSDQSFTTKLIVKSNRKRRVKRLVENLYPPVVYSHLKHLSDLIGYIYLQYHLPKRTQKNKIKRISLKTYGCHSRGSGLPKSPGIQEGST